jgi:endoglucanase
VAAGGRTTPSAWPRTRPSRARSRPHSGGGYARLTRRISSLITTSLALATAGAIVGCSSGGSSTAHSAGTRPATTAPPGPSFYVDPGNPAAKQELLWRQAGRTQDADAIAKLAREPTATWIADDVNVFARVRALTMAASRAGKTALIVAYWIPGRDCGQFSSGGAPTEALYRAWIDQIASAIGSSSAWVILEPDAIPQSLGNCLPNGRAVKARYKLLDAAVTKLAALPKTSVYLDAGHADWINPVDKLVKPLRASGIDKAAGFSLNVSNFVTTEANTSYGNDLSGLLGGKHFVIDTSRNGNGPYTGSDGAPNWCNPPGRAIGDVPSTTTAQPRLDAYLWIKVPGESDGNCRPGAPPAGVWWPEYALSLVRGA